MGRFGKKSTTKRKKYTRAVGTYQEKASAGMTDFDIYLKANIPPKYTVKDENCLRVLPPYWSEDPSTYYSIPVHIHYGIGADKKNIACLQKNFGEACPICEEREKAINEGEKEYAKTLRAGTKYLMYVIDRKAHDKGVQLYAMPITIETTLAVQAVDVTTRAVINIDDPDEGYDISFNRNGKGLSTTYLGIQVARRTSPLADSEEQITEWLKFVEENPLPDVINKQSYETLDALFCGGVVKTEAEPIQEEQKTLEPINVNTEVEETPVMQVTEKELSAFDEEGLIEFIENNNLFTEQEEEDLADVSLDDFFKAIIITAKEKNLIKEPKTRTRRRSSANASDEERIADVKRRFRK